MFLKFILNNKIISIFLKLLVFIVLLNLLSLITLTSIFNLFIVLAEASEDTFNNENNNVVNYKEDANYWYKILGVSILVIIVIIIITQGPGPLNIENITNITMQEIVDGNCNYQEFNRLFDDDFYKAEDQKIDKLFEEANAKKSDF